MSSPYQGEQPPLFDFTGQEAYEAELAEQLWRNFMAEQTAARLGGLGVPNGLDLETNDRPAGMHRVGIIDFGYGRTREALIGGLGESHIALPNNEQLGQSVETARNLVMQMLESQAPGTVRVSVYNSYLTDAFAGFDELGTLFNAVPPGGLQKFLDEISTRHARLAARGSQAGSASEPWRIDLIMNNGNLADRQLDQLNTIVAAGPQYGSLVTIGIPLLPHPNLHSNWYVDEVKPGSIVLDKPPLPDVIRTKCRDIAVEARKVSDSPELSSVVDAELWKESAREGLDIPLGINVATNQPHSISLNNQDTPHGLITGQTGSGKSNVLNALITSMTQRYSPEEVQIDLLDYKMGIEFARYAANPHLPHARLVGEKIDDDPEFGLAALQHITKELDKRGRRAQQLGASAFAELYDDPDNTWPQIVVIIDEFHKLLESNLGNEAASLMLNIARQGRALGVHLLLATQNVSGIDSLASKNEALFKNFALRIATAQGTMLQQLNTAADHVPRNHALVNAASGDASQNVILWMPDASSPRRGKRDVAAYQRRAHEAYLRDCAAQKVEPQSPRIFNSLAVPTLETARDFRRLKHVDVGGPRALLAQELSVADRSAGFRLSRDPGKNIAIIGNPARRTEVNQVLYAAAISLGKQQLPDQATFSLVCLDRQSAAALDHAAQGLRELGHTSIDVIRPENAPSFLSATHDALDPRTERSHFVVVYGADSSAAIMDKPSITEHAVEIGEDEEIKVADGSTVMANITALASGRSGRSVKAPVAGTVRVNGQRIVVEENGPSGNEMLQKLFEEGPANGVHVIASFSSAAKLREAVSQRHGIVRASDVGAYVAIGVQPNELMAFTPDGQHVLAVSGLDRSNRATFYDRTKTPRTVRLYASPDSDADEDEDDD